MMLPKYCSISTYESIFSTGLCSTCSSKTLYFWLNVTIGSFSPCTSAHNYVMACAGVCTSEKYFNISSMISSSLHEVSNVLIKFCTTGSDLLISSCLNGLSDWSHTFLILFIQSMHFSGSVPLNVGIAISAGSSSLLICVLIISVNRSTFWDI